VRGFLTRSGDDRFKNAFDVAYNIVVPKTKDQVAMLFQMNGSPCVTRRFGMLAAVKFDNQPGGHAAEIDDVRFNRHLPPKFESVWPSIAQAEP